MYKVVIETWVEPESECGDGCCCDPPERRWAVVETDIPWGNIVTGKQIGRAHV